MKKIKRSMLLVLLVMVMPVTASAKIVATNLYGDGEGEDGVSQYSSWSATLTIPASKFADFALGDLIEVTVSERAENSTWPQLYLIFGYNSGKAIHANYPLYDLEMPQKFIFDINETAVTAATDPVTTYTPEELLDILKSRGLTIGGKGYTVTRIDRLRDTASEVVSTLHTGELVYGSWNQSINLDAAVFANVPAGAVIEVDVADIDVTVSSWPSIVFQDKSYSNFEPSISYPLYTATDTPLTGLPLTASLTLTQDALDHIAESGMLRIRGAGFTLTEVRLKYMAEPTPEVKGNPSKTIWSGSETISWTTGSSNWVTISASSFTADNYALAGNLLRLYYTDLALSAQIKCYYGGSGWNTFTDSEAGKNHIIKGGHYFDYTISESMLTELQQGGLIVSGTGFNLTRVEIINPNFIPSINEDILTADIKEWKLGEVPKLTLTFNNSEEEEVTTEYSIDVFTDTFHYLTTYSGNITIPAESTHTYDVELPIVTTTGAGFYRLDAYVNFRDVCSYIIGYDAEHIGCHSTAQSDFGSFWQDNLARLAAVDMDVTLTLQEDLSNSDRNVYLVEMKSAPDTYSGEPVTIRGYFAEPVAPGIYPALIRFQGSDGGTSTPVKVYGNANPGWCELLISNRYQMLNRCDNHHGADGAGDYDFYSWGLINDEGNGFSTEKHYYRGAYLDCTRAIDFIASRDKVDTRNIFAAGGSQGGCFSYVAAGLEGIGGTNRLSGIAPSITGHADFVHGMEIVNWPAAKFLAAQAVTGISDEEMHAAISYFDVMNFAPAIGCPVITNFSLQDNTDPPHTNIAPYNLLNADLRRGYSINPFNGHAQASDWGTTYMEWFTSLLDNSIIVKPNSENNGYIITGEGEMPFDTLNDETAIVYDLSSVTSTMNVNVANTNAIVIGGSNITTNANHVAIDMTATSIVIDDTYGFHFGFDIDCDDVTYTRVNDKEYLTVMLPFSLPASTADVYVLETLDGDVLNFVTPTSEIEPYTPLLVTGGSNNVSLAGYNIASKSTTGRFNIAEASIDGLMCGFVTAPATAVSVDNEEIAAYNIYGFSDNKYVRAGIDFSIRPFRAFFLLDKPAPQQAPRKAIAQTPSILKVTINGKAIDDNISTGIENVKCGVEEATPTYNLMGQPVDASYRGIAVRNGRKVIVK